MGSGRKSWRAVEQAVERLVPRELWLTLLVTVGAGGGLVLNLWESRSLSGWLLQAGALTVVMLVGALRVPWVYVTQWARWAWVIGLAGPGAASLLSWPGAGGGLAWLRSGVALILIAGGLLMTRDMLRRPSDAGAPIRCAFPLRGGWYSVVQGGPCALVNAHASNMAQRFALDIFRIGRAGLRTRTLRPEDVEDFLAFGQAVVSPVSGRVIEVGDGQADADVGRRSGPHPAGNHVVIAADATMSVVLAHLKKAACASRRARR
ncbi:MAG: hypothetical protein ACYDH5_11380 [Acidimicrobiales bacterium]